MASATEVLVDDDVRQRLHRVAQRSGQPIAELTNAALRDFLDDEEGLAASIERGIADADAGRVMTSEQVLSLLDKRRAERNNK